MGESSEVKKKNFFSSKGLVVVLLVLFLIIIVLVVAVVWIHVNNTNKGGSEINNTNSLEQQIEALIADDPVYQVSSEISEVYWDDGDGVKEEALRMYDTELSNALAKEDYAFYKDLIITRSSMLLLDDACETLMAQYDKEKDDYDTVPEDYRDSIYATAINDSVECGDAEKEDYWRAIANGK